MIVLMPLFAGLPGEADKGIIWTKNILPCTASSQGSKTCGSMAAVGTVQGWERLAKDEKENCLRQNRCWHLLTSNYVSADPNARAGYWHRQSLIVREETTHMSQAYNNWFSFTLFFPSPSN